MQISVFRALAAAAFAVCLATSTTAETPEERAEHRAELFAALKAAPNEHAAKRVESEIWRFWTTGPNDEASQRLEDAMGRRQSFDFDGALAMLDLLVEAEPEWSEAWNQRAFVRFLRAEYEESLADIARTLELEPKHFGALAGKADILFRRGDIAGGKAVLREAVDIHPWLGMRVLLEAPPGRKI